MTERMRHKRIRHMMIRGRRYADDTRKAIRGRRYEEGYGRIRQRDDGRIRCKMMGG
jgi:hypothetical protein